MHNSDTSMLLPSGMHDLLPDEAEAQTALTQHFLQSFQAFSYRQVKPPLLEEEASLFEGPGNEYTSKSFRTLDPFSNTMLALRPDMTMQIARMASGVLSTSPRPLRLCYAGQSLRTQPESVDPRRQHQQVGLELYGSVSAHADTEVISATVSALHSAHFTSLTLDINIPNIAGEILSTISDTTKAQALTALERKDKAALEALNLNNIASLLNINANNLGWRGTLEALRAHTMHSESIAHVETCCIELEKRLPSLTLTIDPLEAHGFGYHETISYSLFLSDQGKEIARGGRYRTFAGEPATGLSLYADTLLSAYSHQKSRERICVPYETSWETLQELHAQGAITLQNHETADDIVLREQANAHGCTHIWNNETQQKEAL